MNGTCHASAVPAVPLRGPAIRPVLSRALDKVLCWHERLKSRRMLGSLDDRMLRDVGIDRATARREAETPFWR